MWRREVRGGGPGAGRNSLGGRAAAVTRAGGRAWLQAHHSASCLPQARNPSGLSSPLPACWVNIVISPVPPAWDGLVLRTARGHGAGGRQGYGEVTRCLEDDSGPEAAGGAAESQEPRRSLTAGIHGDVGRRCSCRRPRRQPKSELGRHLIQTGMWAPPV